MYIDQQFEKAQQQEINKNYSEKAIPNSFYQDYDMEQELLEIETQRKHFSDLFEDFLANSINPQEETQSNKKRNKKTNLYRRGSKNIMKKQQEIKRKEYLMGTLLSNPQARDFQDFKQNEFQAQNYTEEQQIQEGEWQGDQESRVQEQATIPLFYDKDDQNLMLLNMNNNNVIIINNCNDLNDNQINKNQLLINKNLIQKNNQYKLPNI